MKHVVLGSFFITLWLLVISEQTQEAITSPSTFDDNIISISLLNYRENEAVKKRITLVPTSNYTINIIDIPPIVSFLIFQVHTYQYNITLSYDKLNLNKVSNRSLFGSNVGLYIVPKKKESSFFIKNDNVRKIETLLAVVPYIKQVPVPGGCNMEFNIEVAPYQKLFVNDSIVILDSQSASLPLTSNEIERRCIFPETYHFFLTKHDYSIESYFNAISSMLTVTDILRNGKKIPAPSISPLRRIYSRNNGMGIVYAAVVAYGNNYSAYVPTFTYGFNYALYPEDDQFLNDMLSKLLCILMFIVGLLCVLKGHKMIAMEFVVYTTFFGGIITYIVIKSFASYDITTNLKISMGGSFFFFLVGVISCYMKKHIIVFFSILFSGFLCSSIFYFSVKDSLGILENNWMFWLIYLFIALIVMIILISNPWFGLLLTCAVLGGFMIVLSIAYFANTNFVYIIINVIRRLTVSLFNYAIVSYPLQNADISLIVLWVLLAIIRIYNDNVLRCLYTKMYRHNLKNISDQTPLLDK
ncbi:transmembrane 7 superfamily member 3-like [Vespa velutina]|uniref:transmembrane 7 superfamily member 3-like n=1 Tax=Vespa velutina TaxID=202808 RepID=UPI001FB243B9|nr:transmembrane 7 superfamily member 3-like [Vespa velutina]